MENLGINFLDICVLVIILIFAIKGYFVGFIKMLFSFVPQIAAVLAAYIVTPTISSFLRTTFLYENMKSGVYNALNIEKIAGEIASGAQKNIIESMNLPHFLNQSLLENNNPVIYEILDVSEVGDYVASYVANVCINVISVIIVFVATYIIVKIILSTMDFMAHLPVISAFNTLGGVVSGVLYGVCIVWIIGIFLILFYSSAMFEPIFAMLNESKIALYLYEHNILFFLILKIFA